MLLICKQAESAVGPYNQGTNTHINVIRRYKISDSYYYSEKELIRSTLGAIYIGDLIPIQIYRFDDVIVVYEDKHENLTGRLRESMKIAGLRNYRITEIPGYQLN